MKVAIIGGGIGGLTTALAFKQANIPFKVYESAPELKPVGAGIIIANNAMQVFRYFGIAEAIAANGNRISTMNITKPGLEILSSGNLGHFEKNIACPISPFIEHVCTKYSSIALAKKTSAFIKSYGPYPVKKTALY
ncbi:FAD-dependent monooxygenase [Paraflavitalea speifideaquila]|uniref:FAD-dependent monooxygenase n=1 Tax=Paraflavitalea speifideaquila TaxID=3076558 RepID=UPI003312FC11